MAKKKEEKSKIVLERTYNVPLRKEYMKAPRWRRTKKAVKALREFIIKHMKSQEVKIGKYLNEHLWHHGIKNPPHHIKVKATKDDKGVVTAELVGAPEEKKEEVKKSKKKKAEKEEVKKEKSEKKEAEKKEEKTEKQKEEKEELDRLKKEDPKADNPEKVKEFKEEVKEPNAPNTFKK